MDITRRAVDGVVELTVAGRMDGSWADHLDAALTDVVRQGHHDLRLDLSGVVFLSSAGVGILAKNYQRLTAIGGSLLVVNPSPAVLRVLTIARLADRLMNATPQAARAGAALAGPRRLTRSGAVIDVFELNPSAVLRAEIVRDEWRPDAGGDDVRDVCLVGRAPVFAMGVGAFGASFAECRDRFGELVSVAGGTACLPTDGTNTPDFLVSDGAVPGDIRLLHGLLCDGSLSHLLRFEPAEARSTVGLSVLLSSCLEVVNAPRAGAILIAEASGLVGASLRRSPVNGDAGDFFGHPGIRTRLTFTAEPAFARSLVLAAAIVATPDGGAGVRQLRPLGPGLVGHVHAAVFGFRLLKKGRLDLAATVRGLFEEEPLAAVLHLLHDTRAIGGAGESQFIRGACWAAPIDGAWIRTS